jgi:hypothetical protein
MSKRTVKRTLEEFLEDAYTKHNNKFDYSLVTEYINKHQIISIRCIKHNHIFSQSISDHLRRSKHPCPKCRKESINLQKKKSLEQFISEAKIVHGEKYNYNNANYINNRTKVEIKCNYCLHIFYQSAIGHIDNKQGCPKCYGTPKITLEDFIRRSNEIHNNYYDYSKSDVNGPCSSKTTIICPLPTHGEFLQTRSDHIRGSGCPKCKRYKSKSELLIVKILDKNNIKYIREYMFDDCRFMRKLRFDFKIVDLNICIEFDGVFHYTIEKFYKGEEAIKRLELTKLRDSIKTQYCKGNNIILYRISYRVNLNIEMKKIIKHIKIKLAINNILNNV